jgi:hypothetical protein
MSRELMRAQDFDTLGRRYVTLFGLSDLFVPSNLIHSGDFSMEGMQLPVFLFLLIPLARSRATLLVPVLAAAIVAAIMCIDELRPASALILRLLPPLRLSRFPGGDFRLYIYLGLLVCALSGLKRLCDGRDSFWRIGGLMLIGGATLALLSRQVLHNLPPDLDGQRLTVWMLRDAIYCGLFLLACLTLSRTSWFRRAGAYMAACACAVVMLPVLDQMKIAWNDPAAERNLYDAQGLPLMDGNHRLRVERIFERRESERPARRRNAVVNSQGFLDGSYLSDDKVGTLSVSQQRLQRDPTLLSIAMQPGRLFPVECTGIICETAEPNNISLADRPSAGRAVQYSRNYVVYAVNLASRSLLVENEIYAPGWSGICETHNERISAIRVDGGFRGWVLGPGEHRLRLTYRTPLLATGAFLSALFSSLWLVSIIVWFRAKPDYRV